MLVKEQDQEKREQSGLMLLGAGREASHHSE